MAIPFFTKKLVIEELTHLTYPNQYIRYYTFFRSKKYSDLTLDPQIHQVYAEYLFEPKYRIGTLLQQMNDEIEYLATHSGETQLNLLFNSLEQDLNEIEEKFKRENIIESITKRNQEISKKLEVIVDKRGKTSPISLIELSGIDEYINELQEIFTAFKKVVKNYLKLFKDGKLIPRKSFTVEISETESLIAPFMDKTRRDKQKLLKEKSSLDQSVYSSYKLKNNSPSVKKSITDLMNTLIKFKFIDSGTLISDFRSVFSGDGVSKRILWTRTVSELHYFIDKLYELFENSENTKWQVSANCFVDKKGNSYIPRNLGKAKITEVKANSIEQLNKCCDHLLTTK
ncbi:MAG: hypothetical protein WBM13_10745 [Bacteroidia bacterium]